MPTPKETIGRGLDAHARAQDKTKPFKLAHLAKLPGSIPELATLTNSTKTKRDRLHAIRKDSVAAVETRSQKITADFANVGMVDGERPGTRIDTLGATQRRKLVDRAIADARKEINADTADERAEILAALRADAETLKLVRDVWASPTAILMRATLGSEKRAVYARNLEASGPREVGLAILESLRGAGDPDLGAACMMRLESLGKDGRKLCPYSRSDTADALTGADFLAAQEAIGMADYFISSGNLAALETEGKKISPDQKIAVGVMVQELSARLGKPIDPESTEGPEGETDDERMDRLFPGKPGHNPDAKADAERMAAGKRPLYPGESNDS